LAAKERHDRWNVCGNQWRARTGNGVSPWQNQQFESVSLQRRVSNEPDKLPRLRLSCRFEQQRNRHRPGKGRAADPFAGLDECPRPRSCGNTNHIQWVRLRPPSVRPEPGERLLPGRVTKRSRSNVSAAVNFDRRRVSLRKLEDVGGFLAEIPLPAKTLRHCDDIRCRSANHVDLAVVQ
jgi:hypothetical protein